LWGSRTHPTPIARCSSPTSRVGRHIALSPCSRQPAQPGGTVRPPLRTVTKPGGFPPIPNCPRDPRTESRKVIITIATPIVIGEKVTNPVANGIRSPYPRPEKRPRRLTPPCTPRNRPPPSTLWGRDVRGAPGWRGVHDEQGEQDDPGAQAGGAGG
jgi:hypothetical protein